MGLERYEEAKASFEQALRLSPGEADTRKIVEQLSGMLGEGNNTAAKQVIAPVEIPAILLTAPKAAPEGYGKEYGAYYSRRITAVEFDSENGCKQTDYGRVHVLELDRAHRDGAGQVPCRHQYAGGARSARRGRAQARHIPADAKDVDLSVRAGRG